MVVIREYTYEWTGPGKSPKLNILYAEGDADINALPTAWNGMISARQASFSAQYRGIFRREVRLLESETGVLVGTESLGTQQGYTGTGIEPVADATQALLRFRTGQIRNGRRIQGRAFIPGTVREGEVGGNNGGAAQWTTSAAGLVLSPLVVWSRPNPAKTGLAAQGLAAPVTSVDMWTEFATLRRRRG